MFTKFKNWMKFNPPYAASLEDWAVFEERFKKEAPVRYYIMESGFHNDVIDSTVRTMKDIKRYIKWFFTKPALVDTKLPRQYHENDELMFHACFSILVDYVEIECAHMQIVSMEISDDRMNKEFGWDWKKILPDSLKTTKSQRVQFGIDYLFWEMGLGDESPDQSVQAEKLLSLYLWYTRVRPNRVEPEPPEYPIEGEERPSLLEVIERKSTDPRVKRYHEQFNDYCGLYNLLETKWYEEDDEMLKELVSVRRYIWS